MRITKQEALRRSAEQNAKMEAYITPENRKWAQYIGEIADFVEAELAKNDKATRKELATKMGITESVLSRLLNYSENPHNPTLKTISALSVALGRDAIIIPYGFDKAIEVLELWWADNEEFDGDRTKPLYSEYHVSIDKLFHALTGRHLIPSA